jgi:hypothetical protein
MEENKKRRRDSLEPMPGSLEEEFSLGSHDSRDPDDFPLDQLDYSDDDSEYQSSEDDSTLEEEEGLEDLETLPPEEIMELHAARHELGHVLIDDSHFSKVDSTVDRAETASEKPPVPTSATSEESVGKKSGEISIGACRRQNSIISADLNGDRCVFFSIDLEHGGDKAGILQLSMEAFTRVGEKLGEPFNMYIKPATGSSIPRAMTDVHGLSISDPRIQSASGILDVWPQFKQYIESKLDNGAKKGIMLAWGGKACDCEWLFRVTEVHQRVLWTASHYQSYQATKNGVHSKRSSQSLTMFRSRCKWHGRLVGTLSSMSR